jgi:hypothetical protein
MKKTFPPLLAAALLALALPVPAGAGQQAVGQQVTPGGVLSGIVSDTLGSPVRQRCIRLRNLDTGQAIAESRTDDNGEYRFTGLKPAVYAVEVLDRECNAPVATSQNVPLTPEAPSLSGVVVILPASNAGVAGAAAAGAGAAGGGSFFTSTKGILLLAAAGAGVGVGVYEGRKEEKVTICHNGQTITVSEHAVAAHLAQGDTLGPCPASPVR